MAWRWLVLPLSFAWGLAPPLGTRNPASAGEAVALVRELAALDATRDDIARVHEAAAASEPGVGAFLRRRRRYGLLVDLLRRDGDAYADVAGWLHRARGVGRDALPSRKRVAMAEDAPAADAAGLVADCALKNETFRETPLDAFLLAFTRDRYAVHSPGRAYRSPKDGIAGLLDEMRALMFDPAGDGDAQAAVVVEVLRDLMTPVLPPFYRLFMGGLKPSRDRGDPRWLVDAVGKLPLPKRERPLGAPFYAPYLTSVVAPVVFGFLVGPGQVNRRSDGALGGLVVEKCKFLQESNCKGLCLHQCKRPAEALFDDLGVPLHVSPDFATHECHWAWGVPAPAPEDDPDWPAGCVAGCPSRGAAADLVYASGATFEGT